MIGQDRAKKQLSVGVYNHYKRITSGSGPNAQSRGQAIFGGALITDGDGDTAVERSTIANGWTPIISLCSYHRLYCYIYV